VAAQLAAEGKVRRSREQLTQSLVNGEPVEVEGFLLGGELYRQLCAVDLPASPPPGVAAALVVEFRGLQEAPDRDIGRYIAACRERQCITDHQVLRKTFDWKGYRNYDPLPGELFTAARKWITDTERKHGDNSFILQQGRAAAGRDPAHAIAGGTR
jgi:hypothetical protein